MLMKQLTGGTVGGGGALTLVDSQISSNNTSYTYQKDDYVFFFGSNAAYQNISSITGATKVYERTDSYSQVGGGLYQITDSGGTFSVGSIGGIAFMVFRIQ